MRKVLGVNLLGAVLATSTLPAHEGTRSGAIVNTASVAGSLEAGNAISASKAAGH
jgi:NAD(P)-dependent dehydrogenase (short-subunit alcohol dehydrogenase family)